MHVKDCNNNYTNIKHLAFNSNLRGNLRRNEFKDLYMAFIKHEQQKGQEDIMISENIRIAQ